MSSQDPRTLDSFTSPRYHRPPAMVSGAFLVWGTVVMLTHDYTQAEWSRVTMVKDGDRWVNYPYPDNTLQPFTCDKVVIHWGGNTDPDGPDDEPSVAEEKAILRSWQAYHIDGRGWTDIAYNSGVGNTGASYRLRGWNRSGATSGDYDNDGIPENHEAYAIVWIGGAAGRPTAEAYETMGRLVREVFEVVGREVEVTAHSDHKATACPGDDWRTWIEQRGWELPDAPEDDMQVSQSTWVNTLRDKDIAQMAKVGIITEAESEYFIELLRRTKDGEVATDYQDWINLRNAVTVRGPLYV